MLAILNAVKKWCPYLIERRFKVKIDHDSLKYLEKILSSKEKQEWVTKMIGYDFEFIYKMGIKYHGRCNLKEIGRHRGLTLLYFHSTI